MVHAAATANSTLRTSRVLGDWNEIVGDAFAGIVIDADSESFLAELWNCTLDHIRLIRVRAQPSKVQRWPGEGPRKASGSILLHLQSAGTSINHQMGRSTSVSAGGGALCDPDHRYTVDFPTPYEMFVVELPLSEIILREPDFDIERFAGRQIDQRRSELLIAFLRTAWLQRDCLGDDADWRDCISRTSLDLAMRSISQVSPERVGGVSSAMRRAVIEYIRGNLADPELRTSTIAHALRVSPRSVQMVFERLATTTSGFILKQRLDRAAFRLRTEPGRCSITEIAYDCGFTDSAYFSRCFRRQFSVAPRDYFSRT